MLEQYKGIYRDQRGDEDIIVRNDGNHLFMTLRSVEFEGNHIMSMMPVDITDRPELDDFTLHRYPHEAVVLCACTIEYEMPLPIVVHREITMGMLTVFASIAAPKERGTDTLQLSLSLNGRTYQGNGVGGDFESELNQIQGIPWHFSDLRDKEKFLSEGIYMKACINCAFSDYSPGGTDIYGDMLCHRNNKTGYLAVKTKGEYFAFMHTALKSVQETYLCHEFERRVPGTGYRG